jgi:hypothetical protein
MPKSFTLLMCLFAYRSEHSPVHQGKETAYFNKGSRKSGPGGNFSSAQWSQGPGDTWVCLGGVNLGFTWAHHPERTRLTFFVMMSKHQYW